jgi:hypothetical protein
MADFTTTDKEAIAEPSVPKIVPYLILCFLLGIGLGYFLGRKTDATRSNIGNFMPESSDSVRALAVAEAALRNTSLSKVFAIRSLGVQADIGGDTLITCSLQGQSAAYMTNDGKRILYSLTVDRDYNVSFHIRAKSKIVKKLTLGSQVSPTLVDEWTEKAQNEAVPE